MDALMAFRMLVYMTRLWEQFLSDHPGAKFLPVMVPLLLHHSDTGWTAATAFQDLIAANGAMRPALERHIPHFEMRLIDVSPGRVSALLEPVLTALGKMVLWSLSVAGDDERLKRELGRMGGAMREVLASPDSKAALEVLMRYIAATHRTMSDKQIITLFKGAAGPQGREAIMMFLDKIEARGELKGRREALLELLTARFGRVPARVQARIRAADDEAVGRWIVRVLTAASCAAVIDDDAEAADGARAGSTKRTTVVHRRSAASSKRT